MTAQILIESFISLVGETDQATQDEVWSVLRLAIAEPTPVSQPDTASIHPDTTSTYRREYVPFNPKVTKSRLVAIKDLAHQMDWERNGGLGNQMAEAIVKLKGVVVEHELEASRALIDWPKSKKTTKLIEQVGIERQAYDIAALMMQFFSRIHEREKLKDEIVQQLLNQMDMNFDITSDYLAEKNKVTLLLRTLNERTNPVYTANKHITPAA